MTLAEMRARLKAIATEMRALLQKAEDEKRELTAEEDEAWKKLDLEQRGLSAKVDREQAIADLEARNAKKTTDDPPADPDPAPGTPGNPRTAPRFHQAEQRDYSFLAIARAAKARDPRMCALEQRASDEIRDRVGREPEGLFIPYLQLLPRELRHKALLEQRAIEKGGTGAGLVGVDLMPAGFIEVLRNRSIVTAAGATILDNLVGDVDLPRQTAAGTITWLATESTDLAAEATFATDELPLRPKTVGVRHDISRRMMKQSSPGVEELVRRDISQTIGISIDEKALNGTGTLGTPIGIVNVAGVGAVDLTGGATWADIVEFETDLDAANALQGRLAYAVRPATAGTLKTLSKDTGSGRFVMDEDGTMNGYPVVRSNQLTATNPIIFGNWEELIIGMWGILDFLADPFTLGNRGGVVLRGFQDIDIALRHAASFSKGA